MTAEPGWIGKRALLLLHEESLAEFGGARGLRDEELLDSGLARAQNTWAYGDGSSTIPELAARYGYGLVKNHAFVDGNKRMAFLATSSLSPPLTPHNQAETKQLAAVAARPASSSTSRGGSGLVRLNKRFDGKVETLRELLRLRLADGAFAGQDLRGVAPAAHERGDIGLREPPVFQQRAQKLWRRGVRERITLVFIRLDQ